jgi:hypothetical protein
MQKYCFTLLFLLLFPGAFLPHPELGFHIFADWGLILLAIQFKFQLLAQLFPGQPIMHY